MDKKAATQTIGVLTEALPYIQKFSGKTVVIKYGGNAMVDDTLKNSFARDVALMKQVGINPVVVHGGGPQIGSELEKMGKKSKFVDGMRVTDTETMVVVENVLCNKINKDIVTLINNHGGNAIGLSGKDDDLISVKKMVHNTDLGYVGEVSTMNPDIVRQLSNENRIPVIAPVGLGPGGESYNINADTVAGKLSIVLVAEKIMLLTNQVGLLDKDEKLITNTTPSEIEALINDGIIHSGMLPKIKCVLDAILSGVNMAHIIDGRLEHAVLLELFTKDGIGTLIKTSF
ncbi:MAG: acetylglutamate kinase [Pseudomonadota bacterium]